VKLNACPVLTALLVVATAAGIAAARTWSSSNGKFQIEADLVKTENGKVTLRKPGGDTITVNESQLSDADRAYLQSGGAPSPAKNPGAGTGTAEKNPAGGAKLPRNDKPRNYAGLSEQANDCTSAEEVLSLYKDFLADKTIDEAELQSAKNNLPIWESRAAKKLVRFGTNWLEPVEAQKFREKSTSLIQEAVELVEVKQIDKAREKLRDAAHQDPQSLQATFLNGLLSLSGRRDLTAARQAYGECVRRQHDHVPSLNNLALVEVRAQRYDEAIAHWKSAVATGKVSPEIRQNIGRLSELSASRACVVPPVAMRRLADLQSSFPEGSTHDSHIGWLYMPFDPYNTEKSWIVPAKYVTEGGNGKRNWKTGEDPYCMRCSGLGSVKCPNKDCAKGTVPGGKRTTVAGVSGNGQAFGFTEQTRVACSVCGGSGKVRCPYCVNGIDKNLADSRDPPSHSPSQPRQRKGK
jgi:tetratricopeptide (TPR) repeat protein